MRPFFLFLRRNIWLPLVPLLSPGTYDAVFLRDLFRNPNPHNATQQSRTRVGPGFPKLGGVRQLFLGCDLLR